MKLALLDIGSTAARLEIVDLDRSRMPRADWSVKARTRLAEHTGADGVVDDRGVERAVRAVRHCVRAAADQRPDALVAFGTSAVRDAANGERLRAELSDAAGVRIGVLSPRDEAAVTYHAARRWHGRRGAPMTTVDIGGGTIDVATGRDLEPSEVVSLPLGAARLTRQYLPDDPPRPDQVEELVAAVRRTLRRSLSHFAEADLGHPVALSKVLRQLAVLTESAPGSLARHPDRLSRAKLRPWIPRLAELDQAQRAALPGVSRSRARRILAGAIAAEHILGTIGVDELEICPWGLREGLVFRFAEARECTGGDVRELMTTLFR
ncbi:Ppx/GppA phosphatase family protein [Saccharopolyspora hordei]|uniref:Exopolyphosphatase/guanosine-5'-triphosphate, 3'-diphosphate pyrophosphatase n=1 Tax=Saccharopolyspora hordei TaxID=1838 RepID=A0A853AR04_9PSEU|nr:exopolyphosphatase [Saccharopolyspora hordei]NYI83540.1 exopolyphosphatase/guanosine-5'-triphosphate,3'-diphosphate pyrophosphatase [Saccharopolyspora hordei]